MTVPPADERTIHVAIGNTDNALTQQEWSDYWNRINDCIHGKADRVFGTWTSPTTDPYQNAAWAFAVASEPIRHAMQYDLVHIARQFDQDSVAWNESVTEFLLTGPRRVHTT